MLKYNDILLHTVIFLTSIGIIMVYSASASPISIYISGLSILSKQFFWLIIGSFMLIVTSNVNYRKLIPISKVILFISIVFIILGYITSYNSVTARWVKFFGSNLFQTSELAKIAIIIFTGLYVESLA